MPAKRTTARQRNLYGYGFSGLSLGNLDSAIPGEILNDKEAGLFAICAPSDGKAMSFEYISRSKYHLEQFIQQCIDENTVGKIYKIALHDKLIERVEGNRNLFTNEVVFELGNTPATAVRFSMDVDVINKDVSALVDPGEIYISTEFDLIRDGAEKTFEIVETLTDINNKAYAIDFDQVPHTEGSEPQDCKLRMNSMSIRIPPSFNWQVNTLIINDILFAII